jgi:CBS domain-containing protein
MRISEVMTPDVAAIAPDGPCGTPLGLWTSSRRRSAICLDGRLLGVITDRDITVRSTAAGAAPGEQTCTEIMTST